MVVADLHVHTTNSDGTLTLSTLVDAAEAAGVTAVAVTDHDRLHPELRTPVSALGELTVRGREIIERVEARVGVDLPLEPREGLGRPHIARAIEETTDYSYEDAFEELIGSDCPCYVARDVPTFDEGVAVLEEACGLVSLAHPYRYGDPGAALELCADLDAVERFYPYGREVDPEPLVRAVDRHDLLVTGGTDAHGETLGEAGLDRDDYRRFRAAL
ncbi:PHP domain-containing protein [Halobacteriales archaeon QH_10_70_21]|nr:MAG: PHP domain-containing protein [Halobacteriales archaeon QH_10_70_21]